ncbi:MAG: PAS domain-containing protein [Nitrospirae bacterium]|nr:PAS domain-containing protein [Nitrospirota bacterium]
MNGFFEGQADYIRFFYGLALITLFVVCMVLVRQKAKGLSWSLLGAFGLLQGLQEWTSVLSNELHYSNFLDVSALILSILSFLCLFEFGREMGSSGHPRHYGRKIYVPVLLLTLAGGLRGLDGIDAASRYAIALPGGIMSSLYLFRIALHGENPARNWLTFGSIALGTYSLMIGLVPEHASIFPASIINETTFFEALGAPVQLIKGTLALFVTLSVWSYAQLRISEGEGMIDGRGKKFYIFAPFAAVVCIILTGWLMTDLAGRHARDIDVRDGNIHVSTLANHFTDEIDEAERGAMDLAEYPAVLDPLVDGQPESIGRVRSLLGMCNYSTGAESFTSYLLDKYGKTLASSDVRETVKFDPASTRISDMHFRRALEGGFTAFYAVGPDRKTRNYYAYHPVKDVREEVRGVVVVIKNMDEIEASFKKHAYCFLIDPYGIIFLSSRDDLHYRGLWPLSAARQRYLVEYGQFGPGPFHALLAGEAKDGGTVEFEGRKLLATRRSLGRDGWSLVLLNSTAHIRAYRMFSIFTTFIFFSITAVFFAVIYLKRISALQVETSERRYRSLVEGSPNCVALFDPRGICLSVNQSGVLLTGFRETEIVGRHVDDIWHEIRPAGLKSAVAKAPAGSRYSYESESIRPDGIRVLWSSNLSPVLDADGKTRNIVGIFIDITDRKSTEEKLRRYQEDLEALVRVRTIELSETNQLLRHEMNEREKAEEQLQKYSGKLEHLVEERTTELRTAVALLTSEINYRKNAEDTLKENESKFRSLSQEFHAVLDAIKDELLLVSPDLRILWVNKAFAERGGRHSADISGESCHQVWFGRGDRCDECYALKCFQSGLPQNAQRSAPDGRLQEITAYPISDEAGNIKSVIIVARDITERVTLQAEAMRAAHLASLGELSAGVAHEINNPITGIINYAQIIVNRSVEGSRDNDIAKRIVKEGNRIAVIVRGLLSFAREKREDRVIVSFPGLVMDTLKLTEAQIRKDSINLRTDIPEDLPDIFVNPQQIQQVLLNIISNARYALNRKYPQAADDKILEIYGSEVIQDGIRNVRMVFRDHGIGVPEEIIDKIINPFFSTKPVGEGTGLGLSISHGIIADHGGKLRIESREGVFTSVTIELPVKERHERQA